MRIRILPLLIIAGCGPKAASPVAEPTPPPDAAAARPELSVEECSGLFDQVVRLLSDGIDVRDAKLVWQLLDVNEKHRIGFVQTCTARYSRKDHDCVMHGSTKADFDRCALPRPDPRDLEPGGAAPEPLTCDRHGQIAGPVIVTPIQFLVRGGANVAKLSELGSSKDHPVEVCGFAPSLFAVAELACDDGSHPFGSPTDDASAVVRAAENARHNVGQGGRCDSIIDAYEITCPEATYHVFVDLYFCLPGAWRAEE